MPYARATGCAVLTLAGALLATLSAGCSTSAAGSSPTPTPTPTSSTTPSPTSSPTSPTNEPRAVPRLKGLDVGAAETRARQSGFRTHEHDATGQLRGPITARAWRVCFQTPAAGVESRATWLSVGAVRIGEGCPATDRGANPPTIGADHRLPDFAGRNLQETLDTLGPNAHVTRVDATGQHRTIRRARDWKVCSQRPGAGTVWTTARPVTLEAVRHDETCPKEPR